MEMRFTLRYTRGMKKIIRAGVLILSSITVLPFVSMASESSDLMTKSVVKPLRAEDLVSFSSEEPEIDTGLGEVAETDENNSIKEVINAALDALERDYKAPHVPRDAHAKSHGCLHATFEVNNSSLPEALRVGVFATNTSYDAIVRFSNNTSDPTTNDKDLDLRGIAIKLLKVPGLKILPEEIHEQTQDFLMFGSPIFFVKDVKDYADFVESLRDGNPVGNLFFHHNKSFWQLGTAQIKDSFQRNPLRLRYYSASPYALGLNSSAERRQVKYSAVACDLNSIPLEPQGPQNNKNFMREALKESLSDHKACFNFQVQVGDPQKLEVFPVEDTSVRWPESPGFFGGPFSPYVNVAKLKIPKQDFDTPELDAFCERLSFTPWHALFRTHKSYASEALRSHI